MKSLIGGVVILLIVTSLANAQSVNVATVASEQVAVNVSNNSAVSGKITTSVNSEWTSVQDGGQDMDEPMRSKTFTKTFPADNSDKIVLSNQYGSMQIKIWDRKEVKTDVDIKAYSNNESEAQKLLDEVNIEAGKTGDQIIFKTTMDQRGRNWGSGSRNGKKWRREVRVNYVVYMPASNALTLSQNYGNVVIGDLTGALYAKVQYGDLTAGSLNSVNNYISVQYGKANIANVNKAVIKQQYGSGLTIGEIETLDLDVQYAGVNIRTIKGNAVVKQQYGSGLVIGSVDNIDLNVQYSNVNINTVKGNAIVKQQYNGITIGTVGKLDLNTEYANVTVGTLRGDGKFDMEYNNLNINEVTNGCRALTIDGSYVGISVGFNDAYNADLSVHTDYASFKYGSRVSARTVSDSDNRTSKDYTGKIGNGGGAAVRVTSDYGSLTFK